MTIYGPNASGEIRPDPYLPTLEAISDSLAKSPASDDNPGQASPISSASEAYFTHLGKEALPVGVPPRRK